MKQTTSSKKATSRFHLSTFIAYFFIMMLVFHIRDFINAVRTGKYSYELKYQSVETAENGQEVWQLFRNGEYFNDVNPNDYNLLDSNKNTDMKYCAIIYETRGLVFSAILTAMIVLVLTIAASSRNDTPFTRKNAKRIKAIGYLQFSLAIVPGLIEGIMKSLKFEYIYLHPRIESLYMLVIGFVIFMISKIFNQGVELQEENDLIA